MTQEQTDKLYDHHRQQLSAMLDAELPPDQAKFMLRRLEHDGELAACWERWQVCGDVLRGRHEALLPADFSRRVADAIAGQDRVAASTAAPAAATRRSRWTRWGGGAALAASVAMAALFVGRQAPEATTEPAEPARVVAAATSQGAATQATLDPSGSLPAAPKPAPAPDAGTTLATAAVAVAEVPRRAAERRSGRAQQQRAASRIRREAAAQAPILAAAGDAGRPATASSQMQSAPTVLADAGTAPVVTDLFTTQPQAPSRPWPRAILPGFPADGALTASYGNLDGSAPSHPFHPFEPRVELPPQPDDAPPPPASGPR
ncbi:MAG TPA: sigma-E factor negative regulatory protein [Luteimonas sp.]|nr:sigma-E factor negative regulatory protein [Luteimonas sp.]